MLGEPIPRPARTGLLLHVAWWLNAYPPGNGGNTWYHIGSMARSSDGWKGYKFSNSVEARVRTDNLGAFRRLHKRAAWRMREHTHTGGGRPLDRTNLVMVPSDGVLGTARE